MQTKEYDTKGNQILTGAHASYMARKLHNVMVVQSRKGSTLADAEKAIADAKAGIVYDRT